MSQREIGFVLNGTPVRIAISEQETLVDMLRRGFQLYSVRKSCDQGLCGCCTVTVNGTAVSGCLYLAVFADGAEIETTEGIGDIDNLHPIQEAFIEEGAFQCGFCTPGMVIMTKQLLEENSSPSDEEIHHYLSGNLCRCAAYPQITKAVKKAAEYVGRTQRV